MGGTLGAVGVGDAAGVFREFIELEFTTDERRWGPIDYFRAVDWFLVMIEMAFFKFEVHDLCSLDFQFY